ncbi:MAG: twin-arginine translocase subunit TatC, partial [Acidimicrobiales bacterium]
MTVTDERQDATPDPAGGAAAAEPGTMSLWEHLAELRKRVVIAIIAIAVGATITWFLYNDAIHFMLEPYRSFLAHHQGKDISHGQLIITGVLEGFTTRLKVSVYGGAALASPVVFWELWRFITPGLRRRERQYVVPFTAAATVLFAMGVATAILVFPKALKWLIDVSGNGVVPLLSPQRYFTLYVVMCLVFGLVFMYPLVVVSLELTGVVPSAKWRHWRRPAIVAIAAAAAVL